LADLGLGGRETSSADMVSLGQAKRVAIARAVRAGAKVLFLDEPLAGLDAQGVVSVITMLRDLAHDHQLTLVIVEHIFNIPLILDFATTVWTLKDGKLRVEDPQTVRSEVENQVGDGLLRWMREVAGSDGEIIETPLQSGAILMRVISSSNNKVSAEGRDVVLKVKDLVVRRGKRLVIGDIGQDGVVRGLSFELRRGELLVLQAPNGWGKTTLLEAIAGLVPSSKGSIELLGRPIESVTSWERRRLGLSLLRARDHTFPDLTVREALRLTGVRDVPGNLKHLLDRKCSDLSGGEKQRVALVSALNHKDLRVVLMDEPFSALDIDALHSTWATMKDCLAKAAIVVAIPGKHKALNNTTHI
jgi:ABC-type multidrug transport system ATPase subunit